jgi:acyl dehydratase
MNIKDIYTEKYSFTKDDVSTFIKLSGDTNPIHYDTEYAASTSFGKPIMHGLLAVTIFSKIFGTTFPVPGCIYMEQNFKFIKPMYIDMEYLAEVEIVNIVKNIIYVQTNIKDSDDVYTVLGSAVLKIN